MMTSGVSGFESPLPSPLLSFVPPLAFDSPFAVVPLGFSLDPFSFPSSLTLALSPEAG